MSTISPPRTLIGTPDAEPVRYHRCQWCLWGTTDAGAAAEHEIDRVCADGRLTIFGPVVR